MRSPSGIAEVAPLLQMFSPQAALEQAVLAQQLIDHQTTQPSRLAGMEAETEARKAQAASNYANAFLMSGGNPEAQRFLYESAGVGQPPAPDVLLQHLMQGADKGQEYEALMQILSKLQPTQQ